MNIFEYAKEKEKYTEQFYRQLAETSKSEGLKTIFNMLADQEHHHFEIIDQMKSQYPPRIGDTDILGDAKRIFEKIRKGAAKMPLELRDNKEQFLRSNINVKQMHFGGHEITVYRQAQEFEKKSREFYLEKSREADSPQKEIFEKLAGEEMKHYILLDNIIEMVSRPEQWLENAEWFHLESY